MISLGKKVSIEYLIRYADGSALDSGVHNSDKVTFVQGETSVFPALQQALEGLSSGETTQVRLSPQEAYGPIDDAYFQAVELSLIPEHSRQIGAKVAVEDDDGELFQARLCKMSHNQAILDFNHPLAGKALVFDVKILDVHDERSLN